MRLSDLGCKLSFTRNVAYIYIYRFGATYRSIVINTINVVELST